MPKKYKIDAVAQLEEKLKRSSSFVVTDYNGLTVSEMTEMRDKLRAENVEYKVVKNRLAKIALKNAGLDTLDDHLKGMKAFAIGMKDPVAPAKVLCTFAKDHDKLKVVVGILDNRVVSQAEIVELSKLPSRDVLLSRFLGSMTSPVQKLAYGLNQLVAQVAYVFDAVGRKKAEQGEA